MKLQLSLIVGAACALVSVAHGQSAPGETAKGSVDLRAGASANPYENQRSGVQLRDIPKIGELFRDPPAPTRTRLLLPQHDQKSLFGAQFPPAPRLDAAQSAGTRVRVFKSQGAEIFQVEIVRQSLADVLRKITALMGARAVIAPQLDKQQLVTLVARGRSWDELLSSLPGVEMAKSVLGTYFFAVAPASEGFTVYRQLPDGTYRNEGETGQLGDLFGRVRPVPPAPFSLEPNPGTFGVDPDFVMPKQRQPLQPQPDWDKGEFNGREFYHIPLPVQ